MEIGNDIKICTMLVLIFQVDILHKQHAMYQSLPNWF